MFSWMSATHCNAFSSFYPHTVSDKQETKWCTQPGDPGLILLRAAGQGSGPSCFDHSWISFYRGLYLWTGVCKIQASTQSPKYTVSSGAVSSVVQFLGTDPCALRQWELPESRYFFFKLFSLSVSSPAVCMTLIFPFSPVVDKSPFSWPYLQLGHCPVP